MGRGSDRRGRPEAAVGGERLYRSLPTDRQIIVYCRSGQRSAQVIEALINQVGMPNLLNLTGGIIAWSHAGLPIET